VESAAPMPPVLEASYYLTRKKLPSMKRITEGGAEWYGTRTLT